jgi:hypothetical protein
MCRLTILAEQLRALASPVPVLFLDVALSAGKQPRV